MYAIAVDPKALFGLIFLMRFNNRWITITGNMSDQVVVARVYVINYANVKAGTGAPLH